MKEMTKSYAINRIAELEQENAELKAKVEKLDKMTGIFSARLCEKYRQTLQEIKKIAEVCCSGIECEECPFTDDCKTDTQALGVCRIILKSITKAEEE